jgi:hypothetical protein
MANDFDIIMSAQLTPQFGHLGSARIIPEMGHEQHNPRPRIGLQP